MEKGLPKYTVELLYDEEKKYERRKIKGTGKRIKVRVHCLLNKKR